VLLAVIKYTYLPLTYPNFIQDIEDRYLLLTSSMSFVDLPFQEHRMMEQHHMDTDNMTRADDVTQSPSPTKPKWGRLAPHPWPASQVLVPFQFLLCQRVKEGRCTGYPMPKAGKV
jgi:hypothetical protein